MKSKLLLENWRSFLNENIEDSPEIRQYDIGLVPMSAKPFHEGHMSLIRKAIDECKKVIVYVSITDRSRKGEITIFGEDMKYIWENILEKSIKDAYPELKGEDEGEDKIEFEYGGSPVGKVYKKLEEGTFPENIKKTYAIYTGDEDKGRYSSKYYINMIERVHVRPVIRGKDTPPVSGKLMRSYLSNASEDKFLFLDSLPREVNDNDKEEIFNILFSRLN